MSLESLGPLTLYRFAPASLGVLATPSGAGYQPRTAVEALASGAAAVLNGPMFDLCAGQTARIQQTHPTCSGNCLYQYADCERLNYLHYDAAAGVDAAGSDPRGATIAVVNGQAVALAGGVMPPDASVAVQGYPALVLDGAAQPVSTAGSNGEVVWRSALALLGDGSLALAVARATMPGFAQALLNAGATAAIYTDGGGSTALATAEGERVGATENRPVPSWLVVRTDAGSVSGGGGGTGDGLIVVGLLGVAAAAGLYWWQTRRRGR